MSVTAILDGLRNSQIYCLVYETKVCGLRVALYNVDTYTMEYYDFSLKVIANNTELRDFINQNHANFTRLPLLRTAEGLYFTEEEQQGKIKVSELKTEEQAEPIIKRIKKIYEVMRG